MLRQLFRLCFYAVIITLIIIADSGAEYLFSSPWNTINVPVLILSLVFIWRETGAIVWVAFFTYSILEIFASTPYGVLLFAGTMTWLIGFWLYEYIFTNQSWYTVAALSATTALMYRIILVVAVAGADFFSSELFLVPRTTVGSLLWEASVTSVIATGLYVVVSWIVRRQQRPKTLIWT